ncbi:expressed unknown protein [Ectocarpus siliculosus]|uniref:Uncharacterized protein n=1 Tax=Ectocarpus siliculosus TaxID=2880 RepID=D7FQM6_ECTSI|nr:expressed unknown protein [Ectocarpus siliculosus]|eukprot:CBJ30621.1 expressed unknown protein [Ectocarpus siliculosus]
MVVSVREEGKKKKEGKRICSGGKKGRCWERQGSGEESRHSTSARSRRS